MDANMLIKEPETIKHEEIKPTVPTKNLLLALLVIVWPLILPAVIIICLYSGAISAAGLLALVLILTLI